MNFHDVLPRSYDRNSDPRNVASDGALSIYNANHAAYQCEYHTLNENEI